MSDAHKRNLAVPFFTQRDNTYVWQQLEIKKPKNTRDGRNRDSNRPEIPDGMAADDYAEIPGTRRK